VARVKWPLLLGLATGWLAPLGAQSAASPPIDTDRPDITDGTGVVARGRFQVETGFTSQTSRAGLTSWSLPELLVRIGMVRGAELRVGQTYRSFGLEQGGRLGGFDDLQVGTKIQIARQGSLPAISTELFSSFSTGASGVGAGRALPGAALLLQETTDGPWSAGLEFEVARGATSSVAGFASLSVQYQVTQRAQLFGEFFQLQPDLGEVRQSYLNGGVLFLLSNDLQVDARIGAGLNHDADRSFVGVGLAVRR
jgi:hypothetical protein